MSSGHLLDFVDKNDLVLGKTTYDEKVKNGFITRNVVAFIVDENENFIIPRRAKFKKSYPDKLDVSVCGSVDASETYETAIRRETKEELGIDCEFQFAKKLLNEFYEKGILLRYFTGIFFGKANQEVKLNDELSGFELLSYKNLKEKLKLTPEEFTPSFGKELKFVEKFLEKQ